MLESDYIIDIGPGAGVHGGRIVAAGTPAEIMADPNSITGAYLSGRRRIEVPKERRNGNGKRLRVVGARENNLKKHHGGHPARHVRLCHRHVGLGQVVACKLHCLSRACKRANRAYLPAGKHDRIEGTEHLDKVIAIDQSPIGRTPRSNPATYTGIFSDIRELFASTPDAKMRGYTPAASRLT